MCFIYIIYLQVYVELCICVYLYTYTYIPSLCARDNETASGGFPLQ